MMNDSCRIKAKSQALIERKKAVKRLEAAYVV